MHPEQPRQISPTNHLNHSSDSVNTRHASDEVMNWLGGFERWAVFEP
jgi:hypothetical protein